MKNDEFTLNGNGVGFKFSDVLEYCFFDAYSIESEISEFIVARALGIEDNKFTAYWMLYDILYRDKRIEIKQTSYYHPWNDDGNISYQRNFSIRKAHSNYDNDSFNNKDMFERQNDIYVFCVKNGLTREEANPLNLDNWDFYVIPTKIINEKCTDNQTISLNRIKNLGFSAKKYSELKTTIDAYVDLLNSMNE